MKEIIINADDFGLNSSVNKAIIESFDRGLITSTTLMANMPGFDEAVHLAHKHNLTQKIGVHLVLTDGIPLTKEISSIPFFFNGKESYKKYKHHLFFPNKKIKELIYKEFSAQIEKIQSNNILITHIDTHHHVHEAFGVCKILLALSKKYNISFIRILNNLEKPTKIHKRFYRNFINRYIKQKHSAFSIYFGNQYDFISTINKDPAFLYEKTEIMVHPDYSSDGKLIDKSGKNLDFSFLESLNNANKTTRSVSL